MAGDGASASRSRAHCLLDEMPFVGLATLPSHHVAGKHTYGPSPDKYGQRRGRIEH